MARENSGWGYDRIVGALADLGHRLSDQSVKNILRRHGIAPAPKRSQVTSRKDFLATHMNVLADIWADPVRQEAFQVPPPKWDQEIQALPSDRPHQPLTEGVRFRRPYRRSLVFALPWQSQPYPKSLSRSWIRNRYGCFSASASRNCCSVHCARMRRYIEVQDATAAQFDDDKYIKDAESGCEQHEKVTSHDGLGMIVHKNQPSLTRILRPTAMVSEVFPHSAG